LEGAFSGGACMAATPKSKELVGHLNDSLLKTLFFSHCVIHFCMMNSGFTERACTSRPGFRASRCFKAGSTIALQVSIVEVDPKFLKTYLGLQIR